jgi:hypothetical protein
MKPGRDLSAVSSGSSRLEDRHAPSRPIWTGIRGHACRGNGVVNNELYAGVLVWNRQRFIKDPKTGKRVSRPNPETKWIRTEVPELRIVDDELWQRVKLRQAELATQFGSTIKGVRKARAERLNRLCRPAFLLSGLLTCGCCGGKYGVDKAGARLRRGSVCRRDGRGESSSSPDKRANAETG